MSIKVMQRVWDECSATGSRLLLMLAMADWASEDGSNIYPSIKTLAHKVRLSERHVQRMIAELVEDGVLKRYARKNNSNTYRIMLGKLDKVRTETKRQGVTPVSGGGDASVTPGGDASVTQSVREPLLNPLSPNGDGEQTQQPGPQPTLIDLPEPAPAGQVDQGSEATQSNINADYPKSDIPAMRDVIGQWCGYNKGSSKGQWITCTKVAKKIAADGKTLDHLLLFVKHTKGSQWQDKHGFRSTLTPSFFHQEFITFVESKRKKQQVTPEPVWLD